MGIRKRTRKTISSKRIVYDAEVYVRGQRVSFKTFETRGKAEDWYLETKHAFAYGRQSDSVVQQRTFAEVFSRYREDRLPQLRHLPARRKPSGSSTWQIVRSRWFV